MMDIKISYPHGAGGVWLASLLYYCVTPQATWIYCKTNFHKHNQKIKNFHHVDIADDVLSIGNGNYKYIFWRLYAYKRVIHELDYKRFDHTRIITAPYYTNMDIRDDFFWLLNQCRFIQTYHCPGKFQIDWQNLFYNPQQVWTVICDFLENNKIKNHRNFDQFLPALENYKETCNHVKFRMNFKNKLFKIWALAFLQNNNHEAPADVFYNFENRVIDDWILDNKNLILDYTASNCQNFSNGFQFSCN